MLVSVKDKVTQGLFCLMLWQKTAARWGSRIQICPWENKPFPEVGYCTRKIFGFCYIMVGHPSNWWAVVCSITFMSGVCMQHVGCIQVLLLSTWLAITCCRVLPVSCPSWLLLLNPTREYSTWLPHLVVKLPTSVRLSLHTSDQFKN